MRYLLDTNAWITYLKAPNSGVQRRLSAELPQNIVTCSIVLSELLHGAEKYGNREKRVSTVRTLLAPFQCLPFDEIDAIHYASLRHELELRGEVIGPYDLQIAAICLRNQLTLVTSNLSEFARVRGLQVQDWS
ncbi:PilT protein domain protein [Pirellula staleyi DSM 6068]|uniref:Ribonuclease VapC n=1 Tax=Pirellula staleyi (strain ATCC 27377 / DSM 6068 / ICPB 4128) TaxID=530564 RepID=D2R4W2_PIRSD|nr:type II toxin-antitoxin system VapC family toxin [Pirellula staleyi]ADB18924.1 PilT protein domain protein [Pirellula staleyi DSM 6068]